MPLNHYQQEVGPSLADTSPGKMPDVALLEGRYCSVEHLTVAEHYEDILDFYFTNQILSDWTYMYADPFEYEEAEYVLAQNPEDNSVYLFKSSENGELTVPEEAEFDKVSKYYEEVLADQ